MMPPKEKTRAWSEIIRTVAILVTLVLQGVLIYLTVRNG